MLSGAMLSREKKFTVEEKENTQRCYERKEKMINVSKTQTHAVKEESLDESENEEVIYWHRQENI